MPEIKFDKEQLDSMLASVASELTDMLKSESAALAKGAKEDAPAEESEGSEGPAKPEESSADAGPPAEASAPAEGSAPPPPEASAPEASPEQSAAAMAPEGSPEHEGGEIEPQASVEALLPEYMKLDPEALKMHYLACKQALMTQMGQAQGAAPEASAPAAPPPAAPPGPEASAPMAMGEMSGKKVVLGDANGNGGKIEAGKMGKSEGDARDVEIAALKKNQAEQEEALGKLVKAVETVLQPVRKSVKNLSDMRFIQRAEEPKASPVAQLSKKEITAKLREKARDSKLSKADKELISSYALGGVDVSKIEHLLTDAAK